VPKPLTVTSLSVSGLFGYVDHERITLNDPNQDSRLSILYGDNGAGKTTLLRLLYSCLSPEPGEGHRSFIGRTPFRLFGINLSDGTRIRVEKANLVGDYTFSVAAPGKEKSVFPIATDEDGDVKRQDGVLRLEARLRELALDILFVDHDRKVRSTFSFLAETASLPSVHDWIRYEAHRRSEPYEIKMYRGDESGLIFPLAQVVDAANSWFRANAFKSSSIGEESASEVYLEIAKQLAKRRIKSSSSSESDEAFDAKLLKLNERSSSLVSHGLMSTYPFSDIAALWQQASPNKRIQIATALTPFLDSVQRRLSALRGIDDQMTIFESEINRYFSNKVAHVHVLHGLQIGDANGDIVLDDLSSGEKQLIFLFCAALVARSSRSLIIIDEPELSLNYKWQRMIASSLLAISKTSRAQFIMASHSIEILSRHRDVAVDVSADVSA
jgi:ABC-type lipoprotein export system ATPase subunit